MRKTRLSMLMFGVLLLICVLPALDAATVRVNNVGASPTCPPQYATIQAAVNAASPGDVVLVCNSPTPYNEQVTVSTNSITIYGQNGATIKPGPMTANTTSLSSGFPIAAAILVQNATGVTIANLIVDGSSNGISGCTPNLIGIYYRNASGTAAYNAVRNFLVYPQPNGCQVGLGIFAQSDGSGTSSLTAFLNSVHDFQKNGITGNEANTTLVAAQNVVTGLGVSPIIAQNGIQIFAGKGSIAGNTVTNLVYGPCTDTLNCLAVSTGLLVIDTSGAVTATSNNIGTTQTGIYYIGASGGNISTNNVFNTLVYDGIAVSDDDAIPGGNHTLDKNVVTNSSEAAMWIAADNNAVTNSTISDTPIGIWFFSGAGNSQSGNKFYTTPAPVQNPAPPAAMRGRASSAPKPQPVR